jgi:hypothetical protein
MRQFNEAGPAAGRLLYCRCRPTGSFYHNVILLCFRDPVTCSL